MPTGDRIRTLADYLRAADYYEPRTDAAEQLADATLELEDELVEAALREPEGPAGEVLCALYMDEEGQWPEPGSCIRCGEERPRYASGVCEPCTAAELGASRG